MFANRLTLATRWTIGCTIAAALVVAAAVSIQAAHVRGSTSATYDEVQFLDAGLRVYLDGDFSLLVLERPLPCLVADWAPALRCWRTGIQRKDFPELIAAARLAYSLLVGIPLVLMVLGWLTLRRGILAGAAGAGLLAFSPTIVAHASIATTDACFALCFLGALAAMTWYRESPSWRTLGVVAVTLGLAQASKESGIVLLLLFPLVLIEVGMKWRGERSPARLALGLGARWLAVAVASFLVTWALYGFQTTSSRGFSNPSVGGGAPLNAPVIRSGVPAPLAALAGRLHHARKGHDSYLLGRRSRNGWWYYFPVAFVLKSTPAELFLSCLVALSAFAHGTWRDSTSRLWLLALLVYSLAAMSSPLNLGQRHLFPVYPLLVLIGVDWVSRMFCQRRIFLVTLLGGLVAWQVTSAIGIDPHFLSYFNSLCGGPAQGHLYLVDSNLDWGQDLPALRDEMARLGGGSVMLAYFGRSDPLVYGVRVQRWSDPETALARGCHLVAISATLLQGLYSRSDPFAAFREVPSTARAGFSIFIYDLREPAVKEAWKEVLHRLPSVGDQNAADRGESGEKRIDSRAIALRAWITCREPLCAPDRIPPLIRS